MLPLLGAEMRDELSSESAALGNEPAIRAILEEVCRVTGMGFAAMARVTEERWIACQVVDRIEFGMNPGDELDINTTICNDIRQSGQAVVIDDVRGHADWSTHPVPMLYGFESYASFPIFLEDGCFFGTLCAIDPRPHSVAVAAVVEAMERMARQLSALLGGKVAIHG